MSNWKTSTHLQETSSVHMGRERKEDNTIRLWSAPVVLHKNTSSGKQLQQNRQRMVGYRPLILVKNIQSSSQLAVALKTSKRLLLVLLPLMERVKIRDSLVRPEHPSPTSSVSVP